MEKIDAINWIEQWAGRHQVVLAPMRRLRPGEMYFGLVRRPIGFVPVDALRELVEMGNQLTFEEFGPPPASGGPACGPAAGDSGDDDGGKPPIDNMGGRVTEEVFKGLKIDADSLFAAVDQVTLVGKGIDQREKMKAELVKHLGEGQDGLFGLSTYRQSYRFDAGASLNWSEDREDWCCIITGRTLQLVGEEKHVEFLLDINRHADHCTRCDPRLDDYSRKLIDLDQVREALEAGNFIGPRKCQVVTSGRLSKGALNRDGQSLVFGSRDGARVLFYDKGLESKGRILSIRCEVAYYKQKATAAWAKLMNAAHLGGVEAFTRAVGELVCGAIDFRERGEHRHIARMERLPWWSSIVDKLGAVRVRVPKVISTLNSSMLSLLNQYGKKLARAVVVAEAMGHDLLLSLNLKIDSMREGLEIEQRDFSKLELAFDPLRAFRPARC